eukprot:scaffold35789_cov25-Tisochrysis_lutea.AAC.1
MHAHTASEASTSDGNCGKKCLKGWPADSASSNLQPCTARGNLACFAFSVSFIAHRSLCCTMHHLRRHALIQTSNAWPSCFACSQGKIKAKV